MCYLVLSVKKTNLDMISESGEVCFVIVRCSDPRQWWCTGSRVVLCCDTCQSSAFQRAVWTVVAHNSSFFLMDILLSHVWFSQRVQSFMVARPRNGHSTSVVDVGYFTLEVISGLMHRVVHFFVTSSFYLLCQCIIDSMHHFMISYGLSCFCHNVFFCFLHIYILFFFN